MADHAPIAMLLGAWDIGPVEAVEEIHPDRVFRLTLRGTAPLILKRIAAGDKMLARLEFEHEVLRHLRAAGVPVAAPIADRRGQSVLSDGGWLCTLSGCLADRLEPWPSDPAVAERLSRDCGAAIARLHLALAAFPESRVAGRTWRNDLPGDLRRRWIPAIEQHAAETWNPALAREAAQVLAAVQDAEETLPVQLIHRDCHPGNVVIGGGRVLGFVDFDHLSLGPRIFDLAYFLTGQVYRDVGDPRLVAEWLRLLPVVLIGYDAQSRLLSAERRIIPDMMMTVLLVFAGYFLEAGDRQAAQAQLEAFDWMRRNRPAIEAAGPRAPGYR